jgi:hypothetical protein
MISYLPTIPRRHGRICVAGAYFPGQIPPASVKLAKPSGIRPPDRLLKKNARKITRTRAEVKARRARVVEAYLRLKVGRLVADELKLGLGYVYKALKLSGITPASCKESPR